ncbi:MAG: hypothetical protein MUP55_00495 [Candidatus Aenigmarchaeota archaeon]|nr:hypothetical protein [Candidatus Aenigmarchaeota archaeon]
MAKKAQMFIITTLFLIGLIFSVQQLMFQYTALDLSAPFRENNIYLLQNTKNIINNTIRTTPDCPDFMTKMKELKDFLDKRIPRGGYSLSLGYRLNCTYWDNSPPQTAPLNLTIQIVGKNVETSSRVYLYHK